MNSIAVNALDPRCPLGQHLSEASRLARRAALVLLLGVFPAGAWLALAPLSAAVVANSFVKVDLDRRADAVPEHGRHQRHVPGGEHGEL